MMKKIILGILLGASGIAFASEGVDITLYGGGIDYRNSLKDRAYIGGVYFMQSFIPSGNMFKFEADGERTLIKYKDRSCYGQKDLTGKITSYLGKNWEFSFGGHKIFVDSDDDSEWVVFGGAKYYKYGVFNVGSDFFYSYYNYVDGNSAKVYQVSPYIGAFFGNPYSYMARHFGIFYLELRGNYQKINGQVLNEKDRYFSEAAKIFNYHKNYTLELGIEYGKNKYKVLDGGFVVRNLGDVYKSSYYGKIVVPLNSNLSVTAKYQRIKLDDGGEKQDVAMGYVNYYF